ncbi:MAG: ABC-F family ATP-binding cassette domain-containing protein [Deltaproteobacteria bacterium]|nr:ABC-F family ATP-binding cassette domain-containing protein [Deltaproteobacteria bacterium]
MLQVFDLTKSFVGKTLFEAISFSIEKNEIIGLVGRNGSGKSTLLKIILGTENYDSGNFTFPSGYRVGYLDQHIHFTKKTLLEECCQVLSEDEQYDYYKAEIILFGLGFTEEDLERSPEDFSGGFQLRINLTKTLLKDPDMLLLDEPTNYLDILSLRWLRRFLKGFKGEVILITHDRDFMDSVTTHTMGIQRATLKKVKGQTEKYYSQLQLEDEVHEKARVNQDKKIKDLQKFVDRFGAKASKATQAKSKQRQIDKMKILGQIKSEHRLGFRFNYDKTQAKQLMEVRDLAFSYSGKAEDYLFSNLTFTVKPGDRIAVIGKNGKGKTTLLNVLARTTNPSSGEIELHPKTSSGYYQQTNRKALDPEKTIAEEIAGANPALSISEGRAICGAMMFSGGIADKKISVLSGGEQSRVLLGKVLASPVNLLFLDEPSNHLDMESIEVMIDEVDDFPGGVVIVTHNEEILRAVATKLIVFRSDGAEVFDGTYDEFLSKIGWEEEADLKKTKKKEKTEKKPNKKHQKKKAKEERKQEQEKNTTLKKEKKDLTDKILKLEEDISIKNTEALALSQKGGGSGVIGELYKAIKQLQTDLEELQEKARDLGIEN